VPILTPTALVHPPRHPSIGVMWAQQQYALQAPSLAHSQSSDRIRFDTTRALHSAVSQYYLWDYQVAHPGLTQRDPRTKRVSLTQGVSPTDAIGYTLMATGMAIRMGDESKPPIALTLCQVLWILARLDSCWVLCWSPLSRREVAAAAVTHLLSWLGWLRSRELFSICWGDVRITRPSQGPTIGLGLGIGAIELRLLPDTKGSRTKVADVIISYLCASGLNPGVWMDCLRRAWPEATTTDRVIRGHDGTTWTSQYYWRTHLYAWLHQMQAEGDPFLQAFTSD
jgi:hypothetical protein